MSVIKDLKSKFSSIAWCPEKEHASVMAVATMKDLTPVESESPKSLSLYDWRLDNVAESQMLQKNRFLLESAVLTGVVSLFQIERTSRVLLHWE